MTKCAICGKKVSFLSSKIDGDKNYCDVCWGKHENKKRGEERKVIKKKEKEDREFEGKIKKRKFFESYKDWLVIILIMCFIFGYFSIIISAELTSGTFFEEFLGIIFIVCLFVGLLLGIIFWIIKIVDAYKEERLGWLIILILTGFLMAIIYHFIDKYYYSGKIKKH